MSFLNCLKLSRNFMLLLCLQLSTSCLYAQDEDAIYARYSNEPAVLANMSEKIIIEYINGQLEAKNYVTREKMLIGNLAPGIYNKEYIFHSYFNKLEEYDVHAKVFNKNQYRKISNYTTKTISSDLQNVFYDDVKQTEFTFSGLTPRSIIQTNYTISITDLHMFTPFYLERNLPVANANFQITVPKSVHMKFVIKGDKQGKIIQTTQETKRTITYSFHATDIPALKEYDDIPSDSWDRIHIIYFITSIDADDNTTADFLSSPASLYKYYYNFIKNVNVNPDKALADHVTELTKNDKTELQKAEHIYNWVQQNIYYIAFEDSLGGFIPRQAADIYKRKFGDCKDMASILVAMCKLAGIKAYFTWIGTTKLPYTYNETPLPIVDNHMICTIKIGDDWLFLDGTNQIIPFAQNPSFIQNKEALVALDASNFTILKVPETNSNLNSTIDTTIINISDKSLSGKISIHYTGYPSWNIQSSMMYNHNNDRDELLSDLCSRGSNKFAGKNYKYTVADNHLKDCSITNDFTLDDYVRNIGKEIYVNLNLKRFYENSHIDTQGRSVPVFYKYKDSYHETVILNIPAGYHVSYVPQNDEGKIDKLWEYKINYTTLPNKIILTKDFYFNAIHITANYFNDFNKMIDQLKEQYKETVVLVADK